MSVRRAINEVYLFLRARLEHEEGCTSRRCNSACSFLSFEDSLVAPLDLFVVDVKRAADERERLVALARGDIPA